MKNVVIILTLLIGFTSCVEKKEKNHTKFEIEPRYQAMYDAAIFDYELYSELADSAKNQSDEHHYLLKAEAALEHAIDIRNKSKEYGAPVVE